MRVVVGSAHRNTAHYSHIYLARVAKLKQLLSENMELRVVAVEGDSKDATRSKLVEHARNLKLDLELVTCNHGGPEFGSTEAPERLSALSKVGNAIFDAVREDDTVLLYVECDLAWQPEQVVQLVWHAVNHSFGYDVFAPMVMAGAAFYDIWGFRGKDGRRFSPHSPFYPGLDKISFFEVGSVGSCLAMSGKVARECRIRDENCLVGWCADARAHGYKIAVVPHVTVNQT